MSENTINRSRDNIQKNTLVFAADYVGYYDLLYRDKDYEAEADYVAALIRKFHPSAGSILEMGSGTGIHASLLAEKGFAVHGIERSPEMLARSWDAAKNRAVEGSRLTFTEGDIRDIRLSERFDTVIALFHVISYLTTNEDVTAAFETARQHLNPGGIFIFDIWYGPAVLTERPSVRTKKMADDQTEITRLADPVLYSNENLVDVNYRVVVRNIAVQSVTELRETHTMRYFFKPEIERIADQTHFHTLNTEEWLTGKPIGANTWGACFTLGASQPGGPIMADLVLQKLKPDAIALIVYDFDGVLTDNRVLTLQDGTEAVFANRSDGLAINMIKELGIKQVIISTEINPVVKARADKLGIPCLQGIGDKLSVLKKYLADNHINKDKVVFIGNDINDLPAMNYVGLPVAPADAYPEIKQASSIALETKGGYGVVRELYNLIRRATQQ
ncbi:MAG: methyltransferase domain-containing protein [Syntrophales bacterium]